MRAHFSAGFLLLGALFFAAAAGAEEPSDKPAATAAPAPACRLGRVASLELSTRPDGGITVPVEIQGQTGQMLVDTGSIYSVIGKSEALSRGLNVKLANMFLSYLGGVPMYEMTRTDRIAIGNMVGKDLSLMVIDSKHLPHDTIGMLAPDVLRGFDVEFDFAAGKFNLFDPDHCPGQVVYWTKTPYAAVPMHIDESGHIIIQVTLNGKTVSAGVDTGADRSTITLGLAKSLFGIDANDPKLVTMGKVSVNGTAAAPLYRYPFDTLILEGVTVNHPVIDILDGERFSAGDNLMILGVKTLRQLHMYIAYKENVVYFTPAEAR